MINSNDIEKLSNLARITLSKEEAENMAKDFDSILNYVGQLSKVSASINKEKPENRNIFREDEVKNESGEYTDSTIKNAPESHGEFITVKKIIS